MQPAASNVSDSKVSNSAVSNSTASYAAAASLTMAESGPTPVSAALDAAPVQALSADATAAQTANSSEILFAVVNNPNNAEPSLAPTLTPDSNVPAPTLAPIPATPPLIITTNDAFGEGKPGVSAVPAPAAPPQTTAAATQTAGAPGTGFAIADDITNNITDNTTDNIAHDIANDTSSNNAPPFIPNLAPPSNAPAPIAATTATNDASSKGKPGVSTPPASAVPLPAVPPQTTTTVAAPKASAPETGFATADNIADHISADHISVGNITASAANSGANSTSPPFTPNLTPSLTPNSNAPAPIAATTNDAASNDKLDVSTQPASAAASLTTAADKKLSPAASPNAAPSPDVPAALAAGKDPSATLTAPAPPAAAAPPQVSSDAAPALPQTHQMLDSAPPAPAAPTAAPIAADPNAPAQMHVGIPTDAFGAVEIHTVVQQSQIGITVHSDRDIARWFSSEVPGLESGLNKSHLNLTAVDFDNGRSGVQTATSFQQGQPRQYFSQTPGSPSAASPNASSDKDTASESAAIDILPSDLSAGPAQTHVSIHV
jgi:hypothetical protein